MNQQDERATPRVFPPLYKSTGNVSVDRLAFFHILERLKTQKRTGWVDHKIENPESISDHMYRMAILSMCTSDTKLDIPKCVMMCLVHDVAEAQVGDITPREGIARAEKQRLEAEAMHNFIHEMLHNSPAAQRIQALWQEYEDGESDEARFVKGQLQDAWPPKPPSLRLLLICPNNVDLDRFELACQALEYERRGCIESLQSFFDSSLPLIRHPEVQEWGQDLSSERQQSRAGQRSTS